MDVARSRARFDWLAEIGGAWALAIAGGYAAWKAAPSLALPGPAAMTVSGFAAFALGLLAMWAVPADPRVHRLAGFTVTPVEPDELLLDTPAEEPLLLEDLADDALLLVDRLDQPAPDSRVVQLFASAAALTPGELKDRIDRHLAGTAGHFPDPEQRADASRALYAALAELRRSVI
jgi:hypothetical protein